MSDAFAVVDTAPSSCDAEPERAGTRFAARGRRDALLNERPGAPPRPAGGGPDAARIPLRPAGGDPDAAPIALTDPSRTPGGGLHAARTVLNEPPRPPGGGPLSVFGAPAGRLGGGPGAAR